MKVSSIPRLASLGHGALTAAIALTIIVSGMPHAQAQEDSARKILAAMSNYLASQKSISTTFDTDIEVITPDLQKIQFANSGQLQMEHGKGIMRESNYHIRTRWKHFCVGDLT